MNDLDKNIAIAVVAYNRPRCLQRILKDLNHAEYNSSNVQLIISVDKGDNQDVEEIAKDFNWNHGEKRLIINEAHLGLKQHILAVGDLTTDYDGLIVLEDDLIVAPEFYLFAADYLQHLKSDDGTFGLSLYSYQRTEHNLLPFEPIKDGYDNYFMQIAGSWGQLWIKEKWTRFKTWIESADDDRLDDLPNYMRIWPECSWKKWLSLYLIENDMYYSYPRISFTSNIGENGTNGSSNGLFDVPIALKSNWKEFNVSTVTNSKAIYDAWFELEPEVMKSFNVDLKDFEFTTDLYGTKEKKDVPTEFILSAIHAGSLRSYSGELRPIETNILTNRKGRDFYLAQTKMIDFSSRRPSLHDEKAHALAKSSLLAGDAYLTLTVLIIVKKANVKQLETSLSSLFSQPRKVNILVAYEKEVKNSVDAVLGDHQIDAFEYNQNTALTVAEQKTNTDLFVWANAGVIFDEKCSEFASKVFSSSRWINVVLPIQDRIKANELRLTKYKISKMAKKGLVFSTESMIMRRHVLRQALNGNELNLQRLFPAIMQSADLHILRQFWIKQSDGSTIAKHIKANSITNLESAKMDQQKLGIIKRIVLPFLRLIGKDHIIHNVPDFLNYDSEHEAYYLTKS